MEEPEYYGLDRYAVNGNLIRYSEYMNTKCGIRSRNFWGGIIVSAFAGMEFITLSNPVIGWEFRGHLDREPKFYLRTNMKNERSFGDRFSVPATITKSKVKSVLQIKSPSAIS